jgi:hypothetical protein
MDFRPENAGGAGATPVPEREQVENLFYQIDRKEAECGSAASW